MNPTPVVSGNPEILLRLCKNAASWFYWVAGVTAVIVIINACGGSALGFLGLLVPSVAAATHDHGFVGPAIGIVTAVFGCALYCTFGYFGSKGAVWAFVVGMAFYAIDTLLFGLAAEWLGVALHVYALFNIFRGFGFARQYTATQAEAKAAMAIAQPAAWYTANQPASTTPTAWPPPPVAEPAVVEPPDPA